MGRNKDKSTEDSGSRKQRKKAKSKSKSKSKSASAEDLFDDDNNGASDVDASSSGRGSSRSQTNAPAGRSRITANPGPGHNHEQSDSDTTSTQTCSKQVKRKKSSSVIASSRKQKKPQQDAGEGSDDDDDSNTAKRAGRWYARRCDIWITPQDAVLAGIKCSQEAADNKDPSTVKKKKKSDPLQEHSLELFVTTDNEYDGEQDDDNKINMAAVFAYTKEMQYHSSRARSDDTGKIKRDMDKLLADSNATRIKVWSKGSMGWYNKDTARLLCPMDDVWEFDQDQQGYMDSILNGSCKHWSEWSVFLFDEEAYDEDAPYATLFRSSLLVRIFNHVYNSTGVSKGNGTKTKSPVWCIHGMTEVTPEDIAYVCVQTSWSHKDYGFNVKKFYWGIIKWFRSGRKGSRAALKWWNKEVFRGAGGTKEMPVAPLKDSMYLRLMQESDNSEDDSDSGSGSDQDTRKNSNQATSPPNSEDPVIEADGDVTKNPAAADSDEDEQ
ncbi:hypothetical protein K435DRAFT_861935 [Dendrothele bispora CBS 962.96]|uniref:Uncharacterized protein n=1 Tax=Dendrothele bispora (strain CBS 962.96) TaxID=1314807 RepID=A0A4S8LTY9_DENBC|nr:hypothetical protein K435DRAFT_861935 [Dendrothele bispora CBS 962.96]